ncbi:MAG: hypothetical protein Ta2F_09840 [Termitinemataceae bacterium]|nr:MAG: hypothetical protein Ta2F_09840 [Termitinemataceae bacterium]
MRNYFLVLLVLLICCSAYPKDSFFGNIEFSTGIICGTSNEYVMQHDKTISRLDWEENWIPVISVGGQINVFNFFAGGSLNYGIPRKSGILEDYDFLLEDSNAISHYSRHDAYLDKDFAVSIKTGYTVKVRKWQFAPAIGFLYRTRKWTGTDGYTQYPSDGGAWVGNESKQQVIGTVICYEQSIKHVFASIKIAYTINSNFEVNLDGNFYPYIWAQSLDSHFLGAKQFYDNGMNGGIGGTIGISGLYYVNTTKNRFAVKLNVAYETIGKLKGDTASSSIGATDAVMTNNDGFDSKMASHEWRISAVVVWVLGK